MCIRVALLDKDGFPISGYGLDECDCVRGDGLNKKVTWYTRGDLVALSGKTARFHFELKQAKLFSFQSSADEI